MKFEQMFGQNGDMDETLPDGRVVARRTPSQPCVECGWFTAWRLTPPGSTWVRVCSTECLADLDRKQPTATAPAAGDPVNAPSRYVGGETNAFSTGAVRSKDADETRYDLISPVALRREAEAMAEGATKYGVGNWLKGLGFTDTINHAMRHIELYRQGDTSEDHLAHARCNLAFLMHFEEARPELDDRPFKGANG